MNEEACNEYLAAQGIILWPGVSFYVDNEADRRHAAVWLAELLKDMGVGQ